MSLTVNAICCCVAIRPRVMQTVGFIYPSKYFVALSQLIYMPKAGWTHCKRENKSLSERTTSYASSWQPRGTTNIPQVNFKVPDVEVCTISASIRCRANKSRSCWLGDENGGSPWALELQFAVIAVFVSWVYCLLRSPDWLVYRLVWSSLASK